MTARRRRLVFLNNQGLRSVGGGVGILRAITADLARDHEVVLVSEDAPCGAGFEEHALPRCPGATGALWRFNPWRKALHLKRATDPALIRGADLVIVLDTHFAPALLATRPRHMLHLSLSCVARQEWYAGVGSERWWYAAQYAALERWLACWSEAIVVASPMHAREMTRFTGASRRRMHVLPPVFADRRPAAPAVAGGYALPRNQPRSTLVAVSRLTSVKNLKSLIPVLAGLPGARLAVLGDGDDPGPLQAMARAAGVADRIDFIGAVEDPTPWLEGAAMLLHPSRYESFGMAVHEAMRHGAVPVVFSPGRGRMSAAAELLTQDETGLLVDFDDIDAAAAAIGALLGDPPRLAAMSGSARAVAQARERFDYPGAFRALVDSIGVPA